MKTLKRNNFLLFLQWLANSFKILTYIVFLVFIIGFLTFFSISYLQQDNKRQNQVEQKEVKLNPVEYLVKSLYFKTLDSCYRRDSFLTKSKTSKTIISNQSNSNNPKDKILEDTSNIISHTSNLLTYITIFFAIIGVLGGIGVYKYVTQINILKNETEQLKNKTLDAGLVTISAVPLVEATQITSDEYNLAIETITKSIVENRNNINKNPKYSKLLIVEALHYWNLQDYDHAADILEKALKLAYRGGEDDTVKIINYHLARVYKQMGYDGTKKDKNFEDAEKYAKNTFPEQEKVIKLSLASIKFNEEKGNEKLKNELKNELKNCIGIKEDEEFSENIEIIDFASWTAFTVIGLINDEEIAKKNIRMHYAKQALLLLEEEIHSLAGSNIKASWYNTMSQLSKTLDKKDLKDQKYKKLFEYYQKQAGAKNEKFKVFDATLLIEKKVNYELYV